MTERSTAPVPTLRHFAEIADAYDLVLCDVWGVLHNGQSAHAAAGEALTRFRALPGPRPRRVVLVSNAPRPGWAVREILDRLGVPDTAYDAILTSGDLCHGLIAGRLATHPDAPMALLGPERDRPIFAGLDVRLVPLEEAPFVVCTGPFDDDTETAEDYRGRLEGFLARGVPVVCANPDLVVERDGRLIPCAGAIAELYEAIGGQVIYAGKPHGPVYAAALRMAGDLDGRPAPDRTRVLAVGDAIRTDIAGAHAAGLPSLLVARGIHAEELGLTAEHHSLGDIAAWLSAQPVRPDRVIERLAW